MSKSRYSFPKVLDELKCLYKGRRYRAYAVGRETPFDDYHESGNFIIYDGLYDGVSAVGTATEEKVVGELAFSHVGIEIPEAQNMREFVKAASKEQEDYHRTTVG